MTIGSGDGRALLSPRDERSSRPRHDPAHQSQVDQGQHSLADARRKLAQYRTALDGGADPATVTAWIAEAAQQERAARVELEFLAAQTPAPLSADDARAVVDQLGGMPGLLQHADQDDRVALYAALGVSATYDPATKSAELAVADIGLRLVQQGEPGGNGESDDQLRAGLDGGSGRVLPRRPGGAMPPVRPPARPRPRHGAARRGLVGKNLNDPTWSTARAHRGGPDCHVIVWRLDRLSRDTGDLTGLVRLFERHCVTLHSVNEGGVDVTTAAGRMQVGVHGVFAQFYREHIVENVRMGMEQAARQVAG